ncbi:MAG: hypothetical protein GKS00_00905 [Alphaproteobacteria bacterium]|nr:hypothetical protein [Alphaproteobacteria bacterium]
MTLESDTAEPPKFRVGAALGRSFTTLFRNIVPFGLLAIAFNLPMQLVAFQFTETDIAAGDVNWPLFVVVILGNVVLGFLLSATLVYGTVQELRGGRAGIFECMSRGFGLLFPVLGVGIVVSLIVMFFSLLLIIPGMIAFVMLWVAIPVAVVERPGLKATLSRSLELTKGYRWHLFGLILILAILSWIVGALFGGAVGFGAYFAVGELSFAWTVVINVIVQAFTGALLAVASAVAYHDLRIAKEGASVEQIAAVFD